MAAQHTRRLAALHLPEADLGIGTDTGEPGAIRTPVQVKEGGSVALHDPHTQPALHLPQSQRATLTATEQVAAIGGEG